MNSQNFLNREQTISFLQEVAKLLEKDFDLGVFRVKNDNIPGNDHFGIDPEDIVDVGGVIGARIYDAGMRIVPTVNINRTNILSAAHTRGHASGKAN